MSIAIAAAKIAGELYCQAFTATYGLETVSLRYFNVFGPRQDPNSQYAAVIPKFIMEMLAGRRPTIFGDGRQERDYVFVGDVVEANWAASTVALGPLADLDARAWNIGTGRGTSVHELADRLMRVAGRVVDRRSAAERPGELRRSVLDCSKAASELGWRAKTDLDAGLERTMQHLETVSRR